MIEHDDALTGHEYARRNWQEQRFRDLKSGGWHWGDSRIYSPRHAANLLVLLAIAYTRTVALGSQAVAAGCAQPLVRRPDGTFRRLWSLFKQGLRTLFCPSRSTPDPSVWAWSLSQTDALLETCPLLSSVWRGAIKQSETG